MSPACSQLSPGIRRTMLWFLLLSGFCSCLHHYYLFEEPKTWHKARKYCREKYTDLATIDNMEDMEQLIAEAGSGYEGKVWIGLHDRPQTWTWSLSNSSLYDMRETGFKSWNKGRPKEMGKNLWLCVSFQKGVWNDYFCHESKPFVCYDRKLPGLPSTSLERYVFINKKMNWTNARNHCRKHYTDLASVRNETENMRIQQVVPNDLWVWIGLNRRTWCRWSDNTDATFNNWEEGRPSNPTENCAASVINATHQGKWVENHCDERFHFMCHNNKKQLFYVKLTALNSTIDLSDPAVTGAILNLMEEKMKGKKVTRDFKISWIKKQGKKIFHKEEEKVDVVKTDL